MGPFYNCEVIVLLVFALTFSSGLKTEKDRTQRRPNERAIVSPIGEDPLFLTPLIEKGEIKKAQEASTVPPMLKHVESFSGYLTVNKTTFSNMFFWFFKSQLNNWQYQPIVVWLQGGPGSSSLNGLFNELGPFYVDRKKRLRKRRYSWNTKFNLVFFDNPIGSGFSFTNSEAGYAENENDVARDLYSALLQLLQLFPTLQKNKLFITGESYAGKYIPAIAYKIYKENPKAALKINLSGIFIGNGITDPANQMAYGDHLYSLGLVDDHSRRSLGNREDEIRALIRSGNFSGAGLKREEEVNSFRKTTGLRHVFDFINDRAGEDGPEIQFINSAKTRKQIHVGNKPFYSFNEKTYDHMEKDIMQSLRPWVEELLTAETFRILYFSGQLDLMDPYELSLGFFNALQWPHAHEYRTAKRCKFVVDKEVAGYYKTAGTFTEVLVRNAGHMVPIAQPKWALALLDRFITNGTSFVCP